jgi:hypothetical protein
MRKVDGVTLVLAAGAAVWLQAANGKAERPASQSVRVVVLMERHLLVTVQRAAITAKLGLI